MFWRQETSILNRRKAESPLPLWRPYASCGLAHVSCRTTASLGLNWDAHEEEWSKQQARAGHRVWVLAGLISLTALIGGLGTAIWMYQREAHAHQALQHAEREQVLARFTAEKQRATAEHLLGRELVDDGWTRWERGDFWSAM